MDVQQTLAAWQEIARYRAARKLLKSNAIGSIIFGLVAVYMGGKQVMAFGLSGNPVAFLLTMSLVAVGLFLLVAGILGVVSPGPAALTMSGSGLILVGLWNVFITILNAVAASTHDPLRTGFAVLGVFQIIWGVKMLLPKSRHAAINLKAPAPEALKELDALAASVKGAREKSGPEFVEFAVSSPQPMMLRGKLMPEWALFADQSGTHLFFAAPSDLDLKLKKDGPLQKRNKCDLTLRGDKFQCSVPQASFERIQAWKSRPSTTVPPGATIV